MDAQRARTAFLSFFAKRGHTLVPSSSLVPDNDSSVLLTTAGMQQFKPYFLGQASVVAAFKNTSLASSQKCFRTSDIDLVGDATHHTFFEMLGNFSIADLDAKHANYFKAEAIGYAWEFLVGAMGLDPTTLWVTVFAGDGEVPRDAEAVTLWQRYVQPDRIVAFGRETNWWGPPGKTGSCGPSSEIHVDRTGVACAKGEGCLPNCDCERFVELWNLVFTEYEKTDDGAFKPLPAKQIDTGMGLERLLAVLDGTPDNFQTSVFRTVLTAIDAAGILDPQDDQYERRRRIIADHVRAATFLMSDGVRCSNKDQGYILRRIVRRAFDQCSRRSPDFTPVVEAVVREYAHAYPELEQHRQAILAALQDERQAYEKILAVEVAEALAKVRKHRASSDAAGPSSRSLTTAEAVQLFTTYGLTPDRIRADGYTFEQGAFEAALEQHRSTSREGAEKKFGGHGLHGGFQLDGRSEEDISRITRLHTATHILHQALRTVLGESVHQSGSDITPERLRFDFTFARKLTGEERQAVEDLANSVVARDVPVTRQELPIADALASGALSFFREKYGELVTVYAVGDFSKELCGGPHVSSSGQVGHIRIVSEKSSSAGVRRIKAVIEDPG